MFAGSVATVTTGLLLQDKICVNIYGQSNDFCMHFDSIKPSEDPNKYKDKVLALSTQFGLYGTLLGTIPSVIWSLFIGAFTDKFLNGRKIVMFLSSPYYLLLTSVPALFTGGGFGSIMAVYSYASVHTNEKFRSIRFAIIEFSFFLGIPLGTFVGGQPDQLNSDEDRQTLVDNEELDTNSNKNTAPEVVIQPEPYPSENVKDVWKCCFQKRPNSGRIQIWLMFMTMSVMIMSFMGAGKTQFQFSEKVYLWSATYYSNVHSISSIVNSVLMTISVPLFVVKLRLIDTQIVILGLVSFIMSQIVVGSYQHPIGYYIHVVIGSVSGMVSVAIRSKMSKLVKKEELGKVFSLLSTLESVSPLLASLVFTFIFEWSLDFFPGLTYEVSAALMIVPLIAMVWIDVTIDSKWCDITIQDKAYALGANSCGFLGLGHTCAVKEPQFIEELSFKGYDFVFAQTAEGGLLGWGHNNKGQLGRGDTNYGVFLKPLEIDFGEHEEIVQISCGKNHALALTSSGKVYGWGDNSSGQIGVGKFTDHISTPIKVGSKSGIKNKIRYVFAGYETSFAITIDGQVYSWGSNEFGILGNESTTTSCVPRLINGLKNVVKVCSNRLNTYFLTTNQFVHFCGAINTTNYEFFSKPKVFNMPKVIDIYCPGFEANPLEVLVASNFIYQYYKNQWFKTKFGNFFEYLKGKQITYKAIHLESDGFVSTIELYVKPEDKSKYSSQMFTKESVRYQGFQEFQTMTKLESNSIVRYKRAWIEDNQFVYIQMQFCDNNLKNILQIRKNAFNRHSSDTLIGFTEFYLLCEMFIEINNGLLYLHSLDPPIIHRDLKPENILVVEHNRNGYFVKISDFGLSVFHSPDSQSHSRDAGTEKYMAPEVKFSNQYDMKCDVFSFGLIACEISEDEIKRNKISIPDPQFLQLVNTLSSMINRFRKDRPTSAQILTQISNWKINKDDLDLLNDFNATIHSLENFENKFFHKYLIKKILP
ncbi:unnamed protein product [Oppiella nova]|uniref:Protein kinase domain-containing protein n=1 Tax=Oppiella nova TaxID=334625 RepID=A0A7R9LFR8_9ACAR|nr:unnamed protein product [Oppiella nova]CAG2163229.1 unnamed protein product [Oppiella nova]